MKLASILVTLLGCAPEPHPAPLPPPPHRPTSDELCARGDSDLCDDLAAQLTEGGPDQDLPRAIRLLELSCLRLRDPRGCGLYGDMILTGLGIAEDGPRALALIDGACTGGHARSCEKLGTLYIEGVVKHDYVPDPRGADYMRRACELGEAEACLYYGDFLLSGRGVAVDRDAARGYLERACRMGDARGCSP